MCRMIFLYICFLWKGVNGMSIVEIRHLSFGYDNASDPVFEDVSIHFDTAWQLGHNRCFSSAAAMAHRDGAAAAGAGGRYSGAFL